MYIRIINVIILLIVVVSCNGQYYDKKLHFIAGAAISSITNVQFKDNRKGFWYGIAAGTLAGVGKEAYDKYTGRGNFEFGDFVATTAGAIIGSYITSLIRRKSLKHNKT